MLSDPVKREEYHRLGKSAADHEGLMDPKALFALMFSDFEHIVGDLATATILKTMENSEEGVESGDKGTSSDAAGSGVDGSNSHVTEPSAAQKANASAAAYRVQKREKFQKMREAQLVKLLNRRLEPYLAGDEEAFIEHAKHEVTYLRTEPFGRDCLRTTAYIYRKRAAKIIEHKGPLHGVANFFEDLGDKAHNFRSHYRAFEGGLKALSSAENAGENESVDEAARREAVSTLGAVWLASVPDIESTLRHVAAEVLHSDDKDKAKRLETKKKAEGLMILAKIFEQA